MYGRDNNTVGETSIDDVANAMEIGYHRNVFSTSDLDTTMHTYLLTSSNADAALASKLAMSVQNYGYRYLPKFDAADITVTSGTVPPVLVQIAHDFLNIACSQHRQWSYTAPHYPLLCLPEDVKNVLTDPLMSLTQQPVQVVQRDINRYGVRVMLQDAS